MVTRKLLVVDDSASMRAVVKAYLTADGVDFAEAADGTRARQLLRLLRPDLLILDHHLPDETGFDVLEKVRRPGSPLPVRVLMVTSERGDEFDRRWRELGVHGVLHKPFAAEELVAAVEKVMGVPTP